MSLRSFPQRVSPPARARRRSAQRITQQANCTRDRRCSAAVPPFTRWDGLRSRLQLRALLPARSARIFALILSSLLLCSALLCCVCSAWTGVDEDGEDVQLWGDNWCGNRHALRSVDDGSRALWATQQHAHARLSCFSVFALFLCRDDDDAHYDDFANQLREELKKGAAAQKAGGK